MKLEQSETLQCLINAFAGESQARNRYTFYAKQAKKEGYEKISEIFTMTAENEKEHAKLFYKQIPSNKHWKVNADYPFFLGNTYENLISAANGEREEWEFIYRHGAEIAKEEGFDEISNLFSGILEIEKYHSHRFELFAEELRNNTLFSKPEQTQWICRNCGHIQISKCAPIICPVCAHPQGYFEIFIEKI
ncbi:rubrerythrin family protein [bacterium]|nr:rubrerythrin family protein [bacterium]